jgi:uncharacterized protein (DUF488 family)
MELFTIGHSNYEIDAFIALLKKHQISAVADVRSHPYSRFLPHFNQSVLQKILSKEHIHYVFLGQELGARSDNPKCYVDGKAVYERIAKTDEFHQGLQRILQGLMKHKISLMCAEKDPLTCHRAVLVCQYIRHLDININHILKGGDLESHSHLEERMLAKHGFLESPGIQEQQAQLSLFDQQNSTLTTKEENLEKAYRLQGDEIAYVERNDKHERSNKLIHDWVHSEERSKVL